MQIIQLVNEKVLYCFVLLTDIPIFLASVESVMLAKGLSAPQHSTYLVILLDGRDRVGTPGVAGKYASSALILMIIVRILNIRKIHNGKRHSQVC